jgi:hypothetical protein
MRRTSKQQEKMRTKNIRKYPDGDPDPLSIRTEQNAEREKSV